MRLITPLALRLEVIDPVIGILGLQKSDKADALLIAIALQESALLTRVQYNDGPAHSFWQMERGGGVKGVLTQPASGDLAGALCEMRNVLARPMDVWERMETDDLLGAGFARLLLLTDPRPLPSLSAADQAWDYYQRNWRPGKPHPEKWAANWAEACATVALPIDPISDPA